MGQFYRSTSVIFGVAAVITLFGTGSPAFAQGPPDGANVLTRAASALGVGPGSLTSATITGTITHFDPGGNRSISFETKTTGPGRVRSTFQANGATFTRVIRDGGGWTETSQGVTLVRLSQVSGKTTEFLPVLNLAHWLSSPTVAFEYAGMEEFDGVSFHRLDITRSHPTSENEEYQSAFRKANRCEIYIDSTTLRIARLRYYVHPGDWRNDFPVDLVFSDFQNMTGIQVPLTVTVFRGKRKQREIQIQTIVFNEPISDSDFARSQP